MTELASGHVYARKLNRSLMRVEYGVQVCRLLEQLPLEAVPSFGSSIIEVDPNNAVDIHSHHEHELWVLISGQGVFYVDGQSLPVDGDTLFYMKPHQLHSIANTDATQVLKFISIWWD